MSLKVGFFKRNANSLPQVNMFIIMDYFNRIKHLISSEMPGVKLQIIIFLSLNKRLKYQGCQMSEIQIGKNFVNKSVVYCVKSGDLIFLQFSSVFFSF